MKNYYRIAIAFLILLIISPVLAQSGGAVRVTILGQDAHSFPTIKVDLRVEDANQQAILGLGVGNFTIEEASNSSITVTSDDTGTLHTVIIVDTTGNDQSERTKIKNALAQYASSVYREGDTLTVITIPNELSRTTHEPGDPTLAAIANSLSFSGESTQRDYQNAMSTAQNLLQPYQLAGKTTQIILIGSFLPAGGTVGFTSTPTPIHVWQVHTNQTYRTSSTNGFRAMATGQFVDMPVENTSTLIPFLNSVNNNRQLYHLEYTSQVAQYTSHHVPIRVNTPSAGSGEGILEYSYEVLPVTVAITGSESGFQIKRTAKISEAETEEGKRGYNFDKPSEVISAHVTIPEGPARELTATLIVDAVEQPSFNIAPDASGAFQLIWDVTGFLKEQTANVSIKVVDQFGLAATSAAQPFVFTIDIPLGTTEEIIVDPCFVDGVRLASAECTLAQNTGIAFATLGILVVCVIGLAGVSLWQRQKLAAGVYRMKQSFVAGASNVRESAVFSSIFGGATQVEDENGSSNDIGRYGYGDGSTQLDDNSSPYAFGPSNPYSPAGATQVEGDHPSSPVPPPVPRPIQGNILAQLIVRDGVNVPVIDITTALFTLGRDQAFGVNFAIPQEKVSRVHCTITYDHNVNAFFITDDGSSNGTFINDREIQKKVPLQLEHGDRIRLGKDRPPHILFEFSPSKQLITPATPLPSHLSGGRRTIIEDMDDEDSGNDVIIEDTLTDYSHLESAGKSDVYSDQSSQQEIVPLNNNNRFGHNGPQDDDEEDDDWLN